jgi:peptidoglycan/LPS O-acetylase OafA/YrhL
MRESGDKFLAIEGLRGWLAWGVVLSHLTYMSAFEMRGVSHLLRNIGLPAVLVFIIVSGFVITHVVLEKQESYLPYLVKRFARIFPLYAVSCFIGFFTSDLLATALASPDFADPKFAEVTREVAASNHDNLWMHVVAHALMLHGAIGNAVLPYSEYAFNMPGWSISLEWQFYVLAPLIVMVLRGKPQFMVGLAVSVAILEFVFTKYFFGTIQPGALPAAASYFAVGILSRLAYSEAFEHFGSLLFAAAAAIVFFPLAPEVRPFLIWVVVYFGLPAANLKKQPVLGWTYGLALKSRLAVYFGSRSYSIYLVHFPLISTVVWLFVACAMPPPGMLLLTCICIPLTIVAAELSHRYVELPGIALGKRIASSLQQQPHLWRMHGL